MSLKHELQLTRRVSQVDDLETETLKGRTVSLSRYKRGYQAYIDGDSVFKWALDEDELGAIVALVHFYAQKDGDE